MTSGNKATFTGVNWPSRFSTGVAIFAQVFIAISSGLTAFAADDRGTLIKRFDQLVVPAVEKAVRRPVSDQGGEIAWGTSYQLSALVEMLDATRDPKYAQLIVKLSGWIAMSRDDQHDRRDEVRNKVVAAWSSTNYSQGTRYVWAVHTGMIVAPMARFAAVIRSDPSLMKQWSKDADRLLKIAEEAVAVHDNEYREGPRPDEGYIYSPYLKKHLPLNMQNALVRAWLAIDDATKKPTHRERITRLAQFLKHRLRPMEDGSYVWAYWPPLEGSTEKFEDISHAAINVDFIVRCFEHNIVFKQADLARLEKTLLNRVLVSDDRFSDTVGGGDKFNSYRPAVLKWERLGRHSSGVRERLAGVSQLAEFANDITALPVGIVYSKEKGTSSSNRDLVGHWRLTSDLKDSSGHGSDGINHGVEFTTSERLGKPGGAARFDGRNQFIEVPDNDSLRLGRDDFSIAVWVNTDKLVDDTLGDILSKYDPVTRHGFQLSIMNYVGACTSTANTRNLFFGIDAGSEPKWTDCGRPGNNLLPFALAVYEGDLYAGTFEAGAGEAGHVYRYGGGTNWVDCGSPDICNAVTALAVFEGKLYAATTRYNAANSSLAAAQNLNNGGKVFRYEGGRKWSDCGRVSDAEQIYGLVVFDGKLYASSMDAPPNQLKRPNQGLYRYEGRQEWTYCGNLGGGRVAAMAVSNGKLYGTGYNGGQLGGVFVYNGDTNWTNFGTPPNVDQTYSFAFHNGEMHVGTWFEGKVYRYTGPNAYSDAGRLGQELEVMGMAVYNGKLYGGTLPLAQVYRHDGGTNWTLTGRLDFTDTKYRRAWSMAVYQGRLFCGTLPSGHVHALEAGKAVTFDQELGGGWRHLVAMRHGKRLKLYVDGRLVATSTEFNPADFDIANREPLRIGFGAHDYFNGSMSNLRIYRRSLTDAEVMRLSKEK